MSRSNYHQYHKTDRIRLLPRAISFGTVYSAPNRDRFNSCNNCGNPCKAPLCFKCQQKQTSEKEDEQ
jgi:hypothetical protein